MTIIRRRFLIVATLWMLQMTSMLNAATHIEILDTTFEAHRYELIWNREAQSGLLLISENECVGCEVVTFDVDTTVMIKQAGRNTSLTIADIPRIGVADITVILASNKLRIVNLER